MAWVDPERLFASAKRTILFKLQQEYDKSPKGTIDTLAEPVVHYINKLDDYVTTSSCSGRIAIYTVFDNVTSVAAQFSDEKEGETSIKGQGKWVFVTHGPASITGSELGQGIAASEGDRETYLHVEPFILHVQCRSVAAAQKLMHVAMDAGFRESGIGIGTGGKVIVAVRSNANSMEVPLRYDRKVVASSEYCDTLLRVCKQKFEDIHHRRDKFFAALRAAFPLAVTDAKTETSITTAPATGGVQCNTCAAWFASKNKLFTTHLVHSELESRKVCPKSLSMHACRNCKATFPSRSQLFKHIPLCKEGIIPRLPHLLPPAVPLSPADVEAAQKAESKANSFLSAALKRLETQRTAQIPSDVRLQWTSDAPSAEVPSLYRHGHTGINLKVGKNDVHGIHTITVVFGGHMAVGVHGRTDSVMYKIQDGTAGGWREMSCSGSPGARARHAACAVRRGDSEAMLVFGGHAGLMHPLNDAHWLTFTVERGSDGMLNVKGEWSAADIKNADAAPAPRWAHTIAAVAGASLPSDVSSAPVDCCFVHGGRDNEQSFSDAYLLIPVGTQTSGKPILRWLKVADAETPRFGHSAAAFHFSKGSADGRSAACVLLHGGYATPYIHASSGKVVTQSPLLGSIHAFMLETCAWITVNGDDTLQPRMSHSFLPLPKSISNNTEALIFGGVTRDPMTNAAELLQLKLVSSAAGFSLAVNARRVADNAAYGAAVTSKCTQETYSALLLPKIPAPERRVPSSCIPWTLRSSTVVCARDRNVTLQCIGGGGVAFAFGAHYSAPMQAIITRPSEHVDTAAVGVFASSPSAALEVPLEVGEKIKLWLKARNWFDTTRTSQRVTVDGSVRLLIPCIDGCADAITEAAKVEKDAFPGDVAVTGAIRFTVATLKPSSKEVTKTHSNNPTSVLRERLCTLLRAHGSTASDAAVIALDGSRGLPRQYEYVDDVLLLPAAAFTDEALLPLLDVVWPVVASVFRVNRIGVRTEIAGDGTRSSMVQMKHHNTSDTQSASKHDDDGFVLPPKTVPCASAPSPSEAADMLRRIRYNNSAWVKVKENGVNYIFDITRVMFSSGNVSEKLRMAKLACRNEVVVDLFAGIGYWSIPLLKHCGAAFIHACEWNSDAITCLAVNMVANGIAPERYRLWPGDNMQLLHSDVCGTADRVVLGLIPTSRAAWPLAMSLLKRQAGGRMHLHMNVSDGALPGWPAELQAALAAMAAAMGRRWDVRVERVERVKSYAPHVWHVVADVHCAALS